VLFLTGQLVGKAVQQTSYCGDCPAGARGRCRGGYAGFLGTGNQGPVGATLGKGAAAGLQSAPQPVPELLSGRGMVPPNEVERAATGPPPTAWWRRFLNRRRSGQKPHPAVETQNQFTADVKKKRGTRRPICRDRGRRHCLSEGEVVLFLGCGGVPHRRRQAVAKCVGCDTATDRLWSDR
jgi:hypothetical protein